MIVPRWLRAAVSVCALLVLLASPAWAAPADMAEQQDENRPPARLTEEQRQVVAELQRDILAKRKALIAKYVEYGVISKEKGEHIMKKMERRYAELERNGFIPNWKKCGECPRGHRAD